MEILTAQSILEAKHGDQYLVVDPSTGINVPMTVEQQYPDDPDRIYFTRTEDLVNKGNYNDELSYRDQFRHLRPQAEVNGWSPAVLYRSRFVELLNTGTYMIA